MTETPAPLAPGAVIGILGGGQLGRMLGVAAAQMGMSAHIYCPEADPPAAATALRVTRGEYDDADRLSAFAAAVDVVTFEFENVPASALDALGDRVAIAPGRAALATAQDRLVEKTFLNAAGAPTTPFAEVSSLEDLRRALDRLGAPAILKTRRLGYDGRGQVRIERAEAAEAAFEALAGAPAILEAFAPFRREISVIAARGRDGAFRAFDPAENRHEGGILRESRVPAAAPAEAVEIARRVLDRLDYVGVMGVEMFEMPSGALLVNEIAPRVHNSGHWTIEACAVDQFQQHVRAICGWPLGDPARHADAVMTNLIGDDVAAWRRWAETPGAALHLYGKGAPRPGRKMGHVTVTRPLGR